MRKYSWIAMIALIICTVPFTGCEPIPKMMDTIMPDAEQVETMEMPVGPVDVLIYTGATAWIDKEDTTSEAKITKSRLEAAGFQAEITDSDTAVREWMLQTTGDGNVNVIVLYGVLPASIYGATNTQPDGSIAENWIETTDGDTILNHADYFGWNSSGDVPDDDLNTASQGANGAGAFQNLMDNSNISLFASIGGGSGPVSMIVTSDGTELTPSLANFESYRVIPLNQLQGEWFAEKVFASDTGDAQATYADPVIVRDGNRGRLAIVHATPSPKWLLNGEVAAEGLLNGEVAAEVITNYLLAE